MEYWQDRYASGSDYLELKQTVRDDKRDLAETEKYGPKDKHGKQHKTRYVLRGLDRSVATARSTRTRRPSRTRTPPGRS
ncbi:hypothetical protein GCM10025864_44540 [Luteimicrobium album]|uniref:Uncharacterized protein n=1 Tax=Luteimicrobium album TaxID=1054550 RepID=A0ABQ6HX59_9MICO|nr:hypothetical protein [Luteimicrobium album]GMA22289.1 hypothetical protein GCM10025864_00480 [Luteimicrobium album]GMA26695.1 hypothetical protein GCM10025864_44540 [Luteimicrobium album]